MRAGTVPRAHRCATGIRATASLGHHLQRLCPAHEQLFFRCVLVRVAHILHRALVKQNLVFVLPRRISQHQHARCEAKASQRRSGAQTTEAKPGHCWERTMTRSVTVQAGALWYLMFQRERAQWQSPDRKRHPRWRRHCLLTERRANGTISQCCTVLHNCEP